MTGASLKQEPTSRSPEPDGASLLDRGAFKVAILVLAYAFTGWLGLALAIAPGYATAVWPPSGVALAAALLWGPSRVWPGIWFGSLLVNLWVSLKLPNSGLNVWSFLVAASIATGSTLQALLAAFLIRRWVGTNRLLRHAPAVFAFAGAAALSCLFASTWGVTTLWLVGVVDAAGYSVSWRTWWLGDLIGILVMTPLLLAWFRPPDDHRARGLAEFVVSWLALLCISLVIFLGPLALSGAEYPLAFLPLPCLVWMAYRFSVTHVTVATLLLCGLAVFATSHGSGPFVREATNASLFLLQAFLGLAILTSLALAAAVRAQTLAERDLHASQQQLQLFIAHAPVAIAMFDQRMHYIEVSHRWLSENGLSGRDVRGLSLYEVSPEVPEHWRAIHRRGLSGEVIAVDEERFERPDGSVRWLRWEVRPWYVDELPAGIILLTEDVTERKRAREELLRLNSDLEQRVQERTAQLEKLAQEFEQQSLTDPLTGLANRRDFEHRLEEHIGEAKRCRTALSLLMLDVDRFKAYNDAFGHPEGDVVLREIGLLLRSEARPADVAARYGGEEFAVLLPHTDGDEAFAMADRIRRRIEIMPWRHRAVTVSIGVATVQDDAARFIADADHALYEAKRRGRNRVQAFGA